ncbi:hypothetical protein Patl1_23986 [Pistacia atlantica]|uniref:Uncharacterized protein n=1 Tax=Pistacia atlantica TaxID=434234 RepID=A0ACC0ZWN2_9ROSI|nr:hypothetical protein Patl1_23986 [Pistacia atlantica]
MGQMNNAIIETYKARPCTVRLPPLKSSFVGLEVGERRVSQLRLTCNDRLRCNGLGGGASGSGLNIFERFARIIRSYVNSIAAIFEDPEKIIDQAVIDMNGDLTKMRQATAQVLASQKQLENKCKAAREASEKWYQKAQLALQKGDEGLARDALARRRSFAENASVLQRQLDQQRSFVDTLVSNTRLIEFLKLL